MKTNHSFTVIARLLPSASRGNPQAMKNKPFSSPSLRDLLLSASRGNLKAMKTNHTYRVIARFAPISKPWQSASDEIKPFIHHYSSVADCFVPRNDGVSGSVAFGQTETPEHFE